MGRKIKQIMLNEEQYKSLKIWEEPGKTEERLSWRARVMLLTSVGKSLKEISERMGLSWQNCRDVLRGRVWRSKKELIRQIIGYIRHCNEKKAKPFAWTY